MDNLYQSLQASLGNRGTPQPKLDMRSAINKIDFRNYLPIGRARAAESLAPRFIQGARGLMRGSLRNTIEGVPFQNIATKKLSLGNDFQKAIGDIVSKRHLPMSQLPILVQKGKQGVYNVLDGNHRLAQAMMAGKNRIRAIADEQAYRRLSALEEMRRNLMR